MQHKLSQAQAARAAGVSRATIYRAVRSGRLSLVQELDGSMHIDASELLRVFPDADLDRVSGMPADTDAGADEHARGQDEGGELRALRTLARELREDKHHLRAELDRTLDRSANERAQLLSLLKEKDEALREKDRLLAETMQTVKYITDQRKPPPRWWARFWRKPSEPF